VYIGSLVFRYLPPAPIHLHKKRSLFFKKRSLFTPMYREPVSGRARERHQKTHTYQRVDFLGNLFKMMTPCLRNRNRYLKRTSEKSIAYFKYVSRVLFHKSNTFEQYAQEEETRQARVLEGYQKQIQDF